MSSFLRFVSVWVRIGFEYTCFHLLWFGSPSKWVRQVAERKDLVLIEVEKYGLRADIRELMAFVNVKKNILIKSGVLVGLDWKCKVLI